MTAFNILLSQQVWKKFRLEILRENLNKDVVVLYDRSINYWKWKCVRTNHDKIWTDVGWFMMIQYNYFLGTSTRTTASIPVSSVGENNIFLFLCSMLSPLPAHAVSVLSMSSLSFFPTTCWIPFHLEQNSQSQPGVSGTQQQRRKLIIHHTVQ